MKQSRKPMSDETKKKIAEALTKNNPTPAPTTQSRSKEMAGLEREFNSSQKRIETMKNVAKSLKSEIKTPVKPEKGATKEQKAAYKKAKDAVKVKREEIKAKVKQEREKQKELKNKARDLKTKESANKLIEKAKIKNEKIASNQKKLDGMEVKIKQMMMKAKTPEQKQRAQDALKRVAENRVKQAEALTKNSQLIAEKTKIVNSTGSITKSNKGFFRFDEIICFKQLSFTPWRDLYRVEQKVNFNLLNDVFDNSQVLEDEIYKSIMADSNRQISAIENKIKAGDIAAIAALSFLLYNRFYKQISEKIKVNFEVGKTMASEELKVERPATPTAKNQLNNFAAGQIADQSINEIDTAVKDSVRVGFARGVGIAAIIATVKAVYNDAAKKIAKRAAEIIVSTGVNEGRRLVFEKNIGKIQGYLRSEILDARTCEICRRMDGTQIRVNDTMAYLDQVHSNCRGVWVPILENEKAPSDKWGVSKSVAKAFDTNNRFGIPQKNEFKQIKK